MEWHWALVTGPAQEPLTLDDAKLHARVTHNRENVLIDAYITASRQAFEQFASRAAFTQTWLASFSRFSEVLPLPMAAPLQSVTSVKYYDTDGTLQTLATSYYTVTTSTEPGQIERAPDQSWPSVQADREFPVLITYVAGWDAVTSIPEMVKQGMRLMLASFAEDRLGAAEIEAARRAAEACWAPYRVFASRPC